MKALFTQVVKALFTQVVKALFTRVVKALFTQVVKAILRQKGDGNALKQALIFCRFSEQNKGWAKISQK